MLCADNTNIYAGPTRSFDYPDMSTFQTISPVDGSVYVEREYSPLIQTSRHCIAARPLSAQRNVARNCQSLRAHGGHLQPGGGLLFVANKDPKSQGNSPGRWDDPSLMHPGEMSRVGGARALHDLRRRADALSPPKLIEPKAGFERYIRHEPVGVVFVVAPWNYPYLTSVNAIVPALLAGNAVILKHSVQTPLCAERYAQALLRGGSTGRRVSISAYDARCSASVLSSHQIRTHRFRRFHRVRARWAAAVERSAAGRFISLGLELGGKDPGLR